MMKAAKKHSNAGGISRNVFIILGLLGVLLFKVGWAEAACTTDLSEIPLDTMQAAAPGIIMFCIDDSGSMDWETITPEFDGTFGAGTSSDGACYVLDNPGDNAYSYGVIKGTSATNYNNGSVSVTRLWWKSQWAKWNGLYYDPNVYYTPWPQPGTTEPTAPFPPLGPMANADPNNPRSNPINSTPTFSLSAPYLNWDMSISGETTSSSYYIPVSTFSTSLIPASSTTRTGTWTSNSTGGYNNGSYYKTNTATSACTATWSATVSSAKAYDIYVWYESASTYATNLTYDVKNNTTTVYTTPSISQQSLGSQWVKITPTGGLTFSSGTSKVVLNVPIASPATRATADSVAWVPTSTPATIPNAHYYVKDSSGNTFLVTVNGGSLGYYLVTPVDPNGNNSTSPTNAGTVTGLTPATAAQISALQAASYAGGNYTLERQNFANWYSFYRKRILTAKGAIATVINNMTNVQIGFYTINNNNSVRQYALPVQTMVMHNFTDSSYALLNLLYRAAAGGSTPLRQGMITVGDYFMGKDDSGNLGINGFKTSGYPQYTNSQSYPYYIADYGGSCQQAFIIVTTDGYYNETNISLGNVDGTNCGTWNCGKFLDSVSNTLADVAMYYYMTDLNTYLPNNVPINSWDTNPSQHTVTYTFSFGLKGTLSTSSYPTCPVGTCPTWPTGWNPNDGASDAQKVDDLWHAAINGRGSYLSASNPTGIIAALMEFKQSIQNRLGSAASLAANTLSLNTKTKIYQGEYNSNNWYGDVKAYSIDPITGALGSTVWSAVTQLASVAWNNRIIFTSNGTAGIPFEYGNLSTTQQNQLSSNATTASRMVQSLRGDPEFNTAHGGTLRTLSGPLGDFVHSAPVYYNNVIYIGANDGMLHAFNADNGNEIFAYVPNLVFPNLNLLTWTGYSHMYYVDNTAYIQKIGSKTLLVDGLGMGGKGYFCLDITNVSATSPSSESSASNMFKWEYPANGATDNDMGYSFSQVYFVNTKAAGMVVIFANGYGSVNGEAVLYVLNATTGAVIKTFHTKVFNCNGMSTPAAIDVDGDGYIDYVYAGDLQGNLWKFDFTNPTSYNNWKFSFSSGATPQPLFTAKNASGVVQPITCAPDVMQQCNYKSAGYIVVFGTGKYLGYGDYSNNTTQSLYGIYDWSQAWVNKKTDSTTLYLGARNSTGTLSNLTSNSNLSTTARNATLLQQTITYSNANYVVVSKNSINWYNPATDSGNNVGWYVDLSLTYERLVHDPIIRNGVVVYVSSIPSSSPCSPGGTSVIYQIDACSGGQPNNAQFDVNGDYVINGADIISTGSGTAEPTGLIVNSMVYNPLQIEGAVAAYLLLNSAAGVPSSVEVPNIPKGTTWWIRY